MRFLIIFILIFVFRQISAQMPIGKFKADTLSIGQPITYTLEFSHDQNVDVLFPDSSFNYGPFLFLKKEALPTLSKNGISLDRAVYTFTTFELNNFPKLTLPIYSLSGRDSTVFYSNTDSVVVKQQIQSANLENLEPKSEMFQVKIKSNVSYIKWAIWILAPVFAIFVLFLIFKKGINKNYEILKNQFDHRSFLIKHRKYQKSVLTNEKASEGLLNWKQYLEKIDNKPYTSFSSSEIYKELKDQRLLEALREIDSVIYGNKISGSAQFAFIILGEIADNKFKNKTNYE